MQNSQSDNKISRSQYVSFVQELANNQFQSFGYDADTNTYGNVPTKDFNTLPEAVRQEFNKFACGGANFICDEAYLYTDGTAPDDPVPAPQQEVYLYQVCEGVESAIEETLPKTEKPTGSPTSAPSPPAMVVEETMLLNYQISVPSFITEEGFQNGDTYESEELKEALLTAVQTWAQNTASELSQEGDGSVFARKQRENKQQQHGRVLAVTIDPDQIQFTNITNAVCNTEPTQLRDVCLDIQMEIPLQLSGNQSLTPGEIKDTMQLKFEEALKDGSFYGSLPPEVLDYISGISQKQISKEALSPSPTAQATVVAPSPPQEEVVDPQIGVPSVKAPEPAPAPSPEGGGDSSVVGIAAGVSAGLVVIIAGFFVFRRRQAQKRKFDNTDSTPSFGKRESNDSHTFTKGLLSAFAPKKKDIQSDDLEWGQDQSSDDSGSMQSYSSHSSSGSDSSSYYSTSGSSRGGGPASVSASSASSYDTNPDDFVRPKNNSMTSGKSSSSSEKDTTQLYDLNESGSSKSEASDGAKEDKAILAPDYLQAKDRIDVEGDDDSSAGSSGWESSDGDSSAQTGSVESFDPNAESLGTSVSPSHDGTSAYSEEEMEDRELLPQSLNPAINPVIQRGVTMIPVDEGGSEEDSASTSDDSDSPVGRGDVAPMAQDLDRAIEAGDWAAVGATAAILASDSERDDESASATRSAGLSTKSGSVLSSAASASTGTEYTDESGLDAARAAEIDQLVETGNWDGVVAVAARYADDASMTSGARKPSWTGDDEHHSDASASVESARSIVTGTTKGSNRSSAEGSRGSTRLSGEGSSSKSPRGSSGVTPPEDDMGTHASSITSSYVSRSGISSSMVSNTSSVSNEKQQMNMYRAEVEALVRRVVPDEIDNIDDIMVQFSGREEELIETLKAMQEKSIAQRARAAVQRTAKREKGVLGRSSPDGSDEDYSAQQTLSSDPSSKASNYSSAYTSSGAGDSITEDFTGMSRGSSMYSEGSSYFSREDNGTHDSDDSSYSSGEGSGQSDEKTMEDSYITTEHDGGTNASSLSGAVDASDWRAMGTPAEMLGEKSPYSGKDPLDDLVRGGPSEADRASGRYKVDP